MRSFPLGAATPLTYIILKRIFRESSIFQGLLLILMYSARLMSRKRGKQQKNTYMQVQLKKISGPFFPILVAMIIQTYIP